MQPSFFRTAARLISFLLIIAILFGNAGLSYAALPENAKVSYYLYDHLGGVDKMLDDQGNVICSNDYLPYGDLRRGDCAENNENYGFTGKEKDPETDLMYYGGRYYDPKIGRFITQDPVLMDLEGIKPEQKNAFLSDPQNLSPYSYALNNPLKYVDPNGENPALAILGFLAATVYTYFSSTQNAAAPDVNDQPELPQSETQAIGKTITAAFESSGVVKSALGIANLGLKTVRQIKAYRQSADQNGVTKYWSDSKRIGNHFEDHGKKEFGFDSVEKYTKAARNFFNKKGIQKKVDSEGVTRLYEPKTNTLGAYNKNGTIKTFMKPTGGQKYFDKQPGKLTEN